MKTTLKKIAALAICLIAIQTAKAVPALQLDSPQGTWDPITQTTISTSDLFDIQALAKAPSGTHYLTAVVTPKVAVGGSSFGSFKIGTTTYSVAAGNLLHGAPPNPVGTHDNLFPSYYAQISFTFGASTVPSYDVQTDELASGVLSLKTWAVDMSGLADGYGLHFDLFNLKNGVVDKFAPFSHDAEGNRVPDGGTTAILLGFGVAGLAIARRTRKA